MTTATGRRLAPHRGMTLVELMIAMSVLLLGLVGLLSAGSVALRQNSLAAKQNQATAVARDVLAGLGRWDYRDTRLTTNNTSNDTLILESGAVSSLTLCACELNLDAATEGLLSPQAIDFNEDGQPDYRRQAAIAPVNVNGQQIGIRITAVVSWEQAGGWRQVVLHSMKYDPAGNGAPVPGL